jgi:regulator of sigma D
VRLFADYMAGGHWCVRSDSSSIEGWLMKGDCKDDLRHSYLSEIATCVVSMYFRLNAKHIPGAQNCMADALSHCQFKEVARLLSKWTGFTLGLLGRMKEVWPQATCIMILSGVYCLCC